MTVCVALVCATILAYVNVLWCDFVTYDDPRYVWFNPIVQAGLSQSGWWYAWTTFDCANWHPLTWLSLELDGSFWGGNPRGFHTTNLILHLSNVLLLFAVLRLMTSSIIRSGCVAAFFALHPLHVESVAWISERKDVLSTFFLLLTILAYAKYAARPSISRYLVVSVMLGMGLLAKPMLVTTPILLLLLDRWPLNRISGYGNPPLDEKYPRYSLPRLLLEKIPLFLMAFAEGLMTIVAQRQAIMPADRLPFDVRLANTFIAYLWYLQKTFLPTELAVIYPHPERNFSWTLVCIGAMVVIVPWIYVIRQRRIKPHLLVGWAWFFVSLLPVIGLLQVGTQAYADRYAYVPHIGLLILIVWEVQDWVRPLRIARYVVGIGTIAALVCFGLLTSAQVAHWKDSESLWNQALKVVPDNAVAHMNLAEFLRATDRHEQAIEHVAHALRSERLGKLPNGYCVRARSLLALGRLEEAEQGFLAALDRDPNHERSLNELVTLLKKLGRHEESERFAPRLKGKEKPDLDGTQIDDVNPSSAGLRLARQGKFDQAVSCFEKAIELDPKSASAHNNLGLALAQLNRNSEAKANFLRAIELNPRLAVAHFNLADILETEGDLDRARKHFEDALRLNPGDAEAQRRLKRIPSR
jgi:tetratricopeptide (TPR) repeat protein